MYDELVKRLRECRNLAVYSPFWWQITAEAADAIEELQGWNNALSESVAMLMKQIAELSKPRWIPVTEEMPDSGVCVLVTDGLEVGEGWLVEITNTKGHFLRWCAPTADIDVDRRPITHWRPLPEPPKEE